MTLASPDKRVTCSTCLRPSSTCICRWITPTAHAVDVVLLQHPLEQHNAKGSARLLRLSLSRCRMVTGEAFNEPELRALLLDPFDTHTLRKDAKHTILLYPQTTANEFAPPPLTPEVLGDASHLRLIVIDGTWRKSRKMLHLNPLLQQLPRLSLTEVPMSRYLIRKAHRADQLSTLEATCFALAQLGGDAERFEPLLNAFDGFVAQQFAQRQAGIAACHQINENFI